MERHLHSLFRHSRRQTSQIAVPPPRCWFPRHNGVRWQSEEAQTRPRPEILPLEPTTLNSYTVTLPPNHDQLRYANTYFSADPPLHLYIAAYLRQLPPSPFPEVAFVGRSNVGKSSLLNALTGRTRARDARVSKTPGLTKTMNGYGIPGPDNPIGLAPQKKPGVPSVPTWKRFPIHGGLVVVDMPGYGKGSREEWGEEILKYLAVRKQLRKTFVLVDTEHGPKSTDIELLKHLKQSGVAFQVVMSKADKILYPDAKMPGPIKISNRLRKLGVRKDEIRAQLNEVIGDGRDAVGDILCCSGVKSLTTGPQKLGINEIRWAILTACGLDSDEAGVKRKRFNLGDDGMPTEQPQVQLGG